MRLAPATLARLPEPVLRPLYDRSALTPGILHLGGGAFFRAHLADHTEDALHARFGPWGIRAVNLRPPSLGTMLDAQSGLYIRELRDGATRNRRVIGALLGALTVTDAASLTRALHWATDPATSIITLTVTEKGYCHIPATGRLDPAHPDIRHDAATPHAPRSVPGFVLHTILARRAAGTPQPTFLSCDNVPGNGTTLRACVLALAPPADRPWITDHVAFPDTMVDRIVPATQPQDIAALAAETGLTDQALVIGEPFRMWVITHDPRASYPDWAAAGALIVPDAAPYETLKMRVVNGMQTALCHLGHLAGHRHMSDVMADPLFAAFAARTIRAEVAPHLPTVPGIDADAYINLTIRRLQNTALHHATAQIATDGSRKIRQRLLDPLVQALAAGQTAPGLTLAVAGWMAHVGQLSIQPAPCPVADPILAKVASIMQRTGTDTPAFVAAMLALDQVFAPQIATRPGLADRLAAQIASLRLRGVRATLADHLSQGE